MSSRRHGIDSGLLPKPRTLKNVSALYSNWNPFSLSSYA